MIDNEISHTEESITNNNELQDFDIDILKRFSKLVKDAGYTPTSISRIMNCKLSDAYSSLTKLNNNDYIEKWYINDKKEQEYKFTNKGLEFLARDGHLDN